MRKFHRVDIELPAGALDAKLSEEDRERIEAQVLEQSLAALIRLIADAEQSLAPVPAGLRALAQAIDETMECGSGQHVYNLGIMVGRITIARAILASATETILDCDCERCQAKRANAAKTQAPSA